MSIFSRLFKVGQAQASAIVDKFEDPIRMTEQGIRDLKNDFQQAQISLAQVKGIAIRTRKDSENNKRLAADYERKAMLLLKNGQNGGLDVAEAERLATEALLKKEELSKESVRLATEAQRHEQMAGQLQSNVTKIKSTITSYENDLITLKARAKTAASTRKINEQLARIDGSGTIAMLEKMKAKVEEDESLSQAYGDMVSADHSVDDEINAALGSGKTSTASEHLLELKKKMGLE
ncbi:MAG: PspA/IM30 family protein [Desulfobacterales bacterium]|nr:PspA/IM30 family protein [Desulfobacterales bacterium]MDD4072355.1 PspA/IM30 family protein [Desulfobacterales bacterium]MDD4393027.1 PspA/IM30 family protein [Desulfobacterales bacterium]